MSKSDGNFVTIQDLLETEKFGGRKWPGEVLRLAMLMTHYREPIDFSVRRLEEAENVLAKWPALSVSISDVPQSVLSALQDDMNTVEAVKAVQKLAIAAKADEAALREYSAAANLLGLSPVAKNVVDVDVTAIANSIAQRLTHLTNKDWAAADTSSAMNCSPKASNSKTAKTPTPVNASPLGK